LKTPTDSVLFYRSETKKTKPNPNKKNWKKNQAKPEKTKPNRFESVFFLKNKPKPVGLNQFRFGFGFFFLKN
jgi:hypothetical protein